MLLRRDWIGTRPKDRDRCSALLMTWLSVGAHCRDFEPLNRSVCTAINASLRAWLWLAPREHRAFHSYYYYYYYLLVTLCCILFYYYDIRAWVRTHEKVRGRVGRRRLHGADGSGLDSIG